MTDVELCAKGLVKRFRKQAVLSGFDLELESGSVTVLLGENGAGKTTLMQLLLGTLKPDEGTLSVLGLDPLKQTKKLRQAIGFVPDRPDVYGWMTSLDLMRFLTPQYPTWSQDRALALLGELRVPKATPFRKMSRGEGMKAMLVAALAPEPELLLLDEPFAGLDPIVREEVLRGVIGELRESGRTVLCTTHDLDIAARIADHIAVLSGGRCVEHGTMAEVLGQDEPTRIPEGLRELLERTVHEKEAV